MQQLCTVDQCGKPLKARGLCAMHWRRMKVHGDIASMLGSAPLPTRCSADGCERRPRCRVSGIAYCNRHEGRIRKYGSTELPARVIPEWHACSVDGCSQKAVTRYGQLCSRHTARVYRTGTVDDPVYGRLYLNSSGYLCETWNHDHPVSSKRGFVYLHRKVLYNAIGPGPHRCHWCHAEVEWKGTGQRKLVVDHVDAIKTNNAIENLVPSCHRCNSTRGLFISWVLHHRDDPFLRALFDGTIDLNPPKPISVTPTRPGRRPQAALPSAGSQLGLFAAPGVFQSLGADE